MSDIHSHNHDLEMRIDAALGEKLLNQLTFPLHLDFSEEGDMPLEPLDEPGEEGLEALMEDVVASPLFSHLEQESSHEAKPSDDRRFQIRLRSARVVVAAPPELSLGNPVTLVNMELRVQADLQVGVRAWGKWRWRNESTPWLNLEGCRATIRLSAEGAQLLAMPELENSHVVLRMEIWKWPLRCRFNVSQLINRQLSQRGPFKIVDLADFNIGRQLFGKTAQFFIQHLAESEGELIVKANIEWC